LNNNSPLSPSRLQPYFQQPSFNNNNAALLAENNNQNNNSSNTSNNDDDLRSLPNLKLCTQVKQGERIYIISSPFGLLAPYIFQNSITSGIVSNTLGVSAHHIMLTDARMLPGSEGGGVFNERGELIALCTLPLRRVDSNVELNTAVCLDALQNEITMNIMRRVCYV